jgi:hypothetical protein
MKAYPFLIDQNSSGQRLQPVDIQKPTYTEKWLQDLLRGNPEILPVGEIESVFYPLIPIGRELGTGNGPIDNLFISHRGYLVLVETKLWRNPEAKREVVAQAIDYGSALSRWSYDQLDEVTKNYTKEYENSELRLIEWVERNCGPVEGGRDFFEDTVAKNLRLGRLLILIVGDRIRQSLIEMLDYANKYPHLASDVVLVELRCYQSPSSKDGWPLLVIPNIVARTEIVERSIIQITINQSGTHEIEVKQQKSTGEEKRKRVSLTEEAFWELLMERSPDTFKEVQDIIDDYRKRDEISIDPAEGSIVVRLNIPDTDEQVSVFFVTKNGGLRVWPRTIARQLREAGFDPSLGESYGTQMRKLMKTPENRFEIGRPIREVNIEKFKSEVDNFIRKVQNSDRIKD